MSDIVEARMALTFGTHAAVEPFQGGNDRQPSCWEST